MTAPRWVMLAAGLTAAAGLATGPGLADEAGWVGARVLPRTAHVKLHAYDAASGEHRPQGDLIEAMVKVDAVKGGWLQVRSIGTTGWLATADMVRYDDALDFFTGEIDRNPANHHAFSQRASLWKDRQEFEKALGDYNEAIRLSPKNGVLFNNRGVTHSAMKQHTRALADYDQAIALKPTYALAHHNRGHAHVNVKELDKAADDFSEAIRLVPKYADAWYDRGNVWFAKKEYDKALADFDAAARLDPKEAAPVRSRGYTHYVLKQYAKALADYDRALRINPKLSSAHNDRAWLLAACPDAGLRDGAEAVAAATRANELTAYKLPGHLTVLAAACAEAGDYAAAVKWQKKALEFPDYEKANGVRLRQRIQMFEDGKPYHEKGP